MDSKIRFAIDVIKDEYAYGNPCPWIIGFSGGKDSTSMLQLVWIAMQELRDSGIELNRRVIISSNDTMVENPVITSMLEKAIAGINQAAIEQSMPIECHTTKPRLLERYWVKVIGNGYPIPSQSFRWCTDRLKIQPTSKLVKELIGEYGDAVLLIGTRLSESKTREKSMRRNSKLGKRLNSHPSHIGLQVFSPIAHLDIEHIWQIIRTMPCPWGGNEDLFSIYVDASADDYECPTVVTDKAHKSCGQSRFGCWVCPVVKKDKSMTSLVNNGREELRPLLDLRDQLVAERQSKEFRMPQRLNGQDAVNEMGPYTIEYRADILRRLFIAERKTGLRLIDTQELIAIGVIWMSDWMEFGIKVQAIRDEVDAMVL